MHYNYWFEEIIIAVIQFRLNLKNIDKCWFVSKVIYQKLKMVKKLKRLLLLIKILSIR
jgi:hypothetical protein